MGMMDALWTKTKKDEIKIRQCLITVQYSAKKIEICYERTFVIDNEDCREQAYITWLAKNKKWYVDLAQVFGYKRLYVDTPYLAIEMVRRHLELPYLLTTSEMNFFIKHLKIAAELQEVGE